MSTVADSVTSEESGLRQPLQASSGSTSSSATPAVVVSEKPLSKEEQLRKRLEAFQAGRSGYQRRLESRLSRGSIGKENGTREVMSTREKEKNHALCSLFHYTICSKHCVWYSCSSVVHGVVVRTPQRYRSHFLNCLYCQFAFSDNMCVLRSRREYHKRHFFTCWM